MVLKTVADKAMIADRITAAVARQLHISAGEVGGDREIIDDLGADSLDIIEILVCLETEFGITVPDEEIINIKTVNDAVDYISAMLGF